MNITELARKLKITPQELKERLPELGFSIGERAIQIPDEQAAKVMKLFKDIRQQEERKKVLKKKVEQAKKEVSPEKEKIVYLPAKIQVWELANKLNLPLQTLFSCLLKNGITASLNENLAFEIAAIIAEDLGFEARESNEEAKEKIHYKEEIDKIIKINKEKKLIPRPPVIVIMGHVDHGKTALLSAIYEMDLMQREAGAITQHIGAYQVKKGDKIFTFIDTPGHVAFQTMRQAGGQVADIAILVVAADDGIQPQTQEAIKIIQEEELPFIVAINKIDLPTAKPEKVKKQLMELNLVPEDFGGKVICQEISAKTKKGVAQLLDLASLVAETESQRLMVDPQGELVGTVIESHKDPGFGGVATAIIFNGTLHLNDNLLLPQTYGRARVLKDWQGKKIESAGPSTPVQIFNFENLPRVGDILIRENNQALFKKKIKEIEEKRKSQGNRQETVEMEGKEIINIILKADTLGTLEAINNVLQGLNKENIRIQIVKQGVGEITESDIILANTLSAWIIGFNVKASTPFISLARERNIKMTFYKVIYDLIEDVEKEIKARLSKQLVEKEVGEIEVKACFSLSRTSQVIGGKVISGQARKGDMARVFEGEEPLAEGEILELQIKKEPKEKVSLGEECGIKIKTTFEIKPGHILKIYREEVSK